MIHDAELASYFGVAPEILGYLPELLQDLWELGSNPELVVEWLRDEGLGGHDARVLDLGCGKGAVALAIAGSLGCRVDGVDALGPFVEIARREAHARGLDHLCRFTRGDLRETVTEARGYDAVLLVSVGALGSAGQIVAACRGCVRDGGLLVIDDAYLRESTPIDFPGYRDLATRDETLRGLTSHGDRLVCERRTPLAEVREQNLRYTRWIEHRAEELCGRHPEHADAFLAYVEKERRECAILESAVESALWMLQRT